MKPCPPPRKLRAPLRQRGAALTIGLILLVLLTLIGVTTMRSSSLETSMSGHATDCNVAFQAAEAALRAAELFLENTPNVMINNQGVYTEKYYGVAPCADTNAPCTPRWEDAGIWDGNGSIVHAGTNLTRVARQPRYIIERMQSGVVGWNTQCSSTDLTHTWDCGDYFINLDVAERNLHARESLNIQPLYRITAQGYGAQTDDAGNPVTVVMVQSTFRP